MLRQGRPLNDCIFNGDEDKSTVHLGAFIANQLVGVASAYRNTTPLFKDENAYQVRGVAVLSSQQRKGIGQELMRQMEHCLQQKKVPLVWLNARVVALDFYKALHYIQKGDAFEIEEIGTHYCFYKAL